MKSKLLLSMVAVSTLLMVPAVASTQDKSADVRTLTGCLSKGEGAHEYTLKAEDGGTWELHSKTVKLSPHAGVDKNSTEHGHLNVTNISMVSETCQK
jgi:hypothetical protein